MSQGRYHWSNCAVPARFVRIHAIGCLPWLLLLVRASWYTFYFAIALTAALIYIEIIKKMTLGAFFRSIVVTLTGRVRPTISLHRDLP
ncbi:IcmT/TraK family protein [Tahibacter amnicola]|uniref:IcmT/TraK family protein n=1 Tax=Tahibacter amnicola TaxID=2976241 RepID=A0ABY6BEY4_9GAMM|nr:IcmT/TraK family protein [Tahibacter amnicola]UXI68342.1 IcmT/TraK family protein [Tahibacter amnicola]